MTGVAWRMGTIRNMFLRPRICGLVSFQGEILADADGNSVRGQWDAILTEDEYNAVVAMWGPSEKAVKSRLGARARLPDYLPLSPFVRCGKCSAE